VLGEQEEGDDQEVELNLLGLPLPPPGPPDEPLEEHEGAPCALPHPRGATVPAQSCGPSRRFGLCRGMLGVARAPRRAWLRRAVAHANSAEPSDHCKIVGIWISPSVKYP